MSETFYKLTREEVIEMDDLSKSEMRVLLYMRSCAPFPDSKVEFEAKTVAEELGIDRSTVSKAWKKLDQLGYIDMDIKKISASVVPFSLSRGIRRNGTPVGETAEVSAKSPTNRRNGTDRSLKPAPSLGSTSLQTNKTNKTLKNRERAIEISNFLESTPSFRDFCLRKAQGLPSVPVLLDSWIVANFEELKKMWAKSRDCSGDQNSARPAVVEAVDTERSRSVVNKYPQVQERIDRGELTQDPVFPEGVYDEQGGWWKKADLEALIHVH